MYHNLTGYKNKMLIHTGLITEGLQEPGLESAEAHPITFKHSPPLFSVYVMQERRTEIYNSVLKYEAIASVFFFLFPESQQPLMPYLILDSEPQESEEWKTTEGNEQGPSLNGSTGGGGGGGGEGH